MFSRKEHQEILRQGDVLLIELAGNHLDESRKVEDLILAYGEVTGHAHRIDGPVDLLSGQDDGQLAEFANRGGPALRIVSRNEDVKLFHEEHAPLVIKKGKVYEIRRQREYDATTEARERPVAD